MEEKKKKCRIEKNREKNKIKKYECKRKKKQCRMKSKDQKKINEKANEGFW